MLTAITKEFLTEDIIASGTSDWIDLGACYGSDKHVSGIYVVANGSINLKVDLEHAPAPSDTYSATFLSFNSGNAITTAGWYCISSIFPLSRYIRLRVKELTGGKIVAEVNTSIRLISNSTPSIRS